MQTADEHVNGIIEAMKDPDVFGKRMVDVQEMAYAVLEHTECGGEPEPIMIAGLAGAVADLFIFSALLLKILTDEGEIPRGNANETDRN